MLTCIPEVDLGMEYVAPLSYAISYMLTYLLQCTTQEYRRDGEG